MIQRWIDLKSSETEILAWKYWPKTTIYLTSPNRKRLKSRVGKKKKYLHVPPRHINMIERPPTEDKTCHQCMTCHHWILSGLEMSSFWTTHFYTAEQFLLFGIEMSSFWTTHFYTGEQKLRSGIEMSSYWTSHFCTRVKFLKISYEIAYLIWHITFDVTYHTLIWHVILV